MPKALVCEMCGSNDLVKQDGMYVCQYCNTKYTPDEAKKMMVEIDNTKKLEKLYERARKSLEVDDLEHAAEYYKEILDEVPSDWEAYFYSYLGEFPSYTNGQAGSVAAKLGNTIPAAYNMAIADCTPEEATERVKTITTKVADRLSGIASTGVSLMRQYEGGNILSPAGKVQINMYKKLRPTAVSTIANSVYAFGLIEKKVEELLSENENIDKDAVKEALLYLRRSRYQISNITYTPSAGMTERLIKPEHIKEYAEKVHELDSSFEVPSTESVTDKSGGCYVATAVYGSYDCPQVWTLRRYRDYKLARTWYGRTFIKAYYAISPTLVKWFGDTEWFKAMWRGKLNRMVANLQSQGIESSPYEDRVW